MSSVPPRFLTVLSYNIHKGFTVGNGKLVLKTIREAIRRIHPDLVLLQEVQGHHEIHRRRVHDWPSEPQFEFLAHQVWPHYAYGKNAIYTFGHHGNAILSKYPIIKSENIDISTNRLEQRGLLHAVIQLPGHPFHAMCTHMGLFSKSRQKQIHAVVTRIQSHVSNDEPLVLGGDFNDWTQGSHKLIKKHLHVHEAYQAVHGRLAKTFPSWLPVIQLDRIYYRGLNVRHATCLTKDPWNALSDHAALCAEFEWKHAAAEKGPQP